MSNYTAIYMRVSTDHQDTEIQKRDLQKWVESNEGANVQWYSDTATGKTMDRPGWQRLAADLAAGRVSAIVVWRLDRLGRTASGLTRLFDQLTGEGVNLVSLKDSLDLSTPAGRLMANVLASVAQYETEVRGERVRAGIARARADGKRWGGSQAGRSRGVNCEKIKAVYEMANQNKSVTQISRVTGLSRQWIYELLRRSDGGDVNVADA